MKIQRKSCVNDIKRTVAFVNFTVKKGGTAEVFWSLVDEKAFFVFIDKIK